MNADVDRLGELLHEAVELAERIPYMHQVRVDISDAIDEYEFVVAIRKAEASW